MTWPTWFEIKEDFKAARRGERRVAPYGTRGRVYEAKPGSKKQPFDKIKAKARPTATISARVIRADGTIEELGVIAGPADTKVVRLQPENVTEE